MPLKTVLLFLFEKLGHGRKKSVLNYYETEKVWGEGVLLILQEEKLLAQAEDAKTIICTVCEKGCDKIIESRRIPVNCVAITPHPSNEGKFIPNNGFHCGEHRHWINVIPRQWEITNQMLIDWLTDYLHLEPPKEANRLGVVQLGTLTLDGENYALALGTADELVLLVNGNAVLMSELFSASEGGAIEVNTDLIEQHKLAVTALPEVKREKALSTKRQRNQSETQNMYATWQKKYKELRKINPNKSRYTDNRVAIEIAKLPIAQGRSKDTIRKHMIA